jgi:hypothetical protein
VSSRVFDPAYRVRIANDSPVVAVSTPGLTGPTGPAGADGNGSGAGVTTAGPVYVTSGLAGGNANPNTASAWVQLAAVGEVAIAATAGDHLEVCADFLSRDSNATDYDLAVLTAGVLVWFGSSGSSSPAAEGDPSLYPSGGDLVGKHGRASLTAQAGHIDLDGWMHFVLAVSSSNGTGDTYYSAAYPFRWVARNFG